MRFLKQAIDSWADSFIPTKFKGETNQWAFLKAKLLVLSSFIICPLLLISFSNIYFSMNKISFESLISIFFVGSLPLFLRKTGDYRTAASIIPMLGVTLLPFHLYFSGGLISQFAAWSASIPLISLFFLGTKRGFIYTIVSLVQLSFFIYLHLVKHQFPMNYDSSNLPVNFGVGIMSMFLFITFLGWQYETSNKESRDALKKSREKALTANKAKDLFWANISHEIKTPLNGILGMTSLLFDSRLTQEQKEIIEIIKDSGEHLNIILGDVIDYSKLSTGELEIIKKPFPLQKTLDQVIHLFDHMAKEKGIELSYIIDSDVPSGIHTDEHRLKQILINLIVNGIKFTENGHVKVIVEKSGQKNHLRFIVEDTGLGIPTHKLDRLFKPFSQIDNGSARKYGGTGLGLVICKKLSEKLGGQIKVESQYGKGSCFSFTIEALAVQMKQLNKSIDNQVNINDAHNSIRSIKLNILIVEDNPINQKILLSLLNKNGYKADKAFNGIEALKMIEKKEYDLVFMDIQMPEMDGITATREIFKRFPDKRPRIVAVTANVLQEDRNKCFEVGMDDFLAKPINSNILLSVLRRYAKKVHEVGIPFENHQLSHSIGLHRPAQVETKPITSKGPVEFKTFKYYELFENYAGDLEVINTIADQFSRNCHSTLKELKAAINEEQYHQIELHAHTLKGTLKSLFAKEALTKAIQLEKMGRDENITDVHDAFESLSKHIQELDQELSQYLSDKFVA